jgi:hypothetical protein
MSMRYATTNRPKPRLICPSCIEDKRLSVLDYSFLCLWYFCRVCEYKLTDEEIYLACPTSKL